METFGAFTSSVSNLCSARKSRTLFCSFGAGQRYCTWGLRLQNDSFLPYENDILRNGYKNKVGLKWMAQHQVNNREPTQNHGDGF